MPIKEYYSVPKKKAILAFVPLWKSLKDVNYTERNKPDMEGKMLHDTTLLFF